MIRSRHWHRSTAWPVSYWRGRIEKLRKAPAVAQDQQAELLSLLGELERIAAQLDSSSKYGEISQIGARPAGGGICKA
jgi:hypothetical protein